jgi:hypothetical protein
MNAMAAAPGSLGAGSGPSGGGLRSTGLDRERTRSRSVRRVGWELIVRSVSRVVVRLTTAAPTGREITTTATARTRASAVGAVVAEATAATAVGGNHRRSRRDRGHRRWGRWGQSHRRHRRWGGKPPPPPPEPGPPPWGPLGPKPLPPLKEGREWAAYDDLEHPV